MCGNREWPRGDKQTPPARPWSGRSCALRTMGTKAGPRSRPRESGWVPFLASASSGIQLIPQGGRIPVRAKAGGGGEAWGPGNEHSDD